jgi:hypothetical protein
VRARGKAGRGRAAGARRRGGSAARGLLAKLWRAGRCQGPAARAARTGEAAAGGGSTPCLHPAARRRAPAPAGYLQARNGSRLSLPPAGLTAANLSVTPNFDASKYDPMKFLVAVDPAYGSIHANITVPAAAQLVQYEVALLLPPGGASVTTEDFQVADPRPPTAVLNLTAPNWVRRARGRRGQRGLERRSPGRERGARNGGRRGGSKHGGRAGRS